MIIPFIVTMTGVCFEPVLIGTPIMREDFITETGRWRNSTAEYYFGKVVVEGSTPSASFDG